MAKFEMTKSVEARKLNKRTGFPTNDPAVTIPYGAILDEVEETDDYVRFTYLMERYMVPRALVRGAIQMLGEAGTAGAGSGDGPDTPAEKPKPRLQFLSLSSNVSLSRAKIPGGWLVAGLSGALTFVPDASHAWDGTSIPE